MTTNEHPELTSTPEQGPEGAATSTPAPTPTPTPGPETAMEPEQASGPNLTATSGETAEDKEARYLLIEHLGVMLMGGMEVPAIAEELGLSEQTIYKWANTYWQQVLDKVNANRDEEVVAAYQETTDEPGDPTYPTYKYNVLEITDAFGVSQATLYKILQRHKPPIDKRRSTANLWAFKTPENSQAIIDDYRRGVIINDICIKYGISNNTLYRLLDKHDIPRRLSDWADPDRYRHLQTTPQPDGRQAVIVVRRVPGEPTNRLAHKPIPESQVAPPPPESARQSGSGKAEPEPEPATGQAEHPETPTQVEE